MGGLGEEPAAADPTERASLAPARGGGPETGSLRRVSRRTAGVGSRRTRCAWKAGTQTAAPAGLRLGSGAPERVFLCACSVSPHQSSFTCLFAYSCFPRIGPIFLGPPSCKIGVFKFRVKP